MRILKTSINLFNTGADILVNPVNCVGRMGAGLAKTFKQRYSHTDMLTYYQAACETGVLKYGGVPILYELGDSKYVMFFPTKHHYREVTDINKIRSSLNHLTKLFYPEMSIAIPKLGCGLGGLDYGKDLKPLLKEYLPLCNFKKIIVCE